MKERPGAPSISAHIDSAGVQRLRRKSQPGDSSRSVHRRRVGRVEDQRSQGNTLRSLSLFRPSYAECAKDSIGRAASGVTSCDDSEREPSVNCNRGDGCLRTARGPVTFAPEHPHGEEPQNEGKPSEPPTWEQGHAKDIVRLRRAHPLRQSQSAKGSTRRSGTRVRGARSLREVTERRGATPWPKLAPHPALSRWERVLSSGSRRTKAFQRQSPQSSRRAKSPEVHEGGGARRGRRSERGIRRAIEAASGRVARRCARRAQIPSKRSRRAGGR